MAKNPWLKSWLKNLLQGIKSYSKIFIGILLSTLTIVLLIVGAMFFLLKGSCESQICQTIDCPINKYKVVAFQRDCGATTNFSTQISLLRRKQELSNKSGNIFIAESTGAPINNQGIFYTDIKWLDNKTILINHPKAVKIFKQEFKIKGITVRYRIVDTPNSFNN